MFLGRVYEYKFSKAGYAKMADTIPLEETMRESRSGFTKHFDWIFWVLFCMDLVSVLRG